jgi:hypothetical protein
VVPGQNSEREIARGGGEEGEEHQGIEAHLWVAMVRWEVVGGRLAMVGGGGPARLGVRG